MVRFLKGGEGWGTTFFVLSWPSAGKKTLLTKFSWSGIFPPFGDLGRTFRFTALSRFSVLFHGHTEGRRKKTNRATTTYFLLGSKTGGEGGDFPWRSNCVTAWAATEEEEEEGETSMAFALCSHQEARDSTIKRTFFSCVTKYALGKMRKDVFPPFFGVFGGETRILEPPFINAIPIPAGKIGNAAMDLLLGIRQKGKI